jgi:hypothetical protein
MTTNKGNGRKVTQYELWYRDEPEVGYFCIWSFLIYGKVAMPKDKK